MPNIQLPPGFPARLRSLRSARHLSESDLAEKCGLTYKTIHALEAGKRQRVMERTILTLAEALELTEEDLLGGDPGSEATRPPSRLSMARILTATGMLLMVLVLVFGGAFLYGRAHADWSVEHHILTARDAVFGIKLWETHNQATWTMGEDSPWDKGHILMGTGSATPDGGRLICLERATGDTVWSVGPDVEAVVRAFGPEIVGAAGFSTSRFEPMDMDGDGEYEMVIRFIHGLYYPCCICLIDRDGNLLRQYANKGHLIDFLVEDIDADGKDEVLAWGTNNDLDYQGFTTLLLDDEHWSGAAVDDLCCGDNSERDGSALRLVVPAYEAPFMKVIGRLRLTASHLDLVRNTAGETTFSVRVGGDRYHCMQVMLDAEMRPLMAVPTDAFMGHMQSAWADSLVDGTGPSDPAWRETWLDSGRRFVAGQPVDLR